MKVNFAVIYKWDWLYGAGLLILSVTVASLTICAQEPLHLSCSHREASEVPGCALTEFKSINDERRKERMARHWNMPTATQIVITLPLDKGDSGCSNAEFTVVTLTTSSPNPLVLSPSAFEMEDDSSTASQDDGCKGSRHGGCSAFQHHASQASNPRCTFSLPGDVIWADAYYKKGRKGSPKLSDATTEAEDSAQPAARGKELRKLYYGINQPGAVQATFIYKPSVNSTDNGTITADVLFQPYWWSGNLHGWFGTSVLYNYDSRPKQDPDALIALLTYAWRVKTSYWAKFEDLLVRPIQVNVSPVGVEYAPASVVSNVMFGETNVRLPFVLNAFGQPSAVTFTPLVGMEPGHVLHNNVVGGIAPGLLFRGVVGANMGLRIGYAKLTRYLGNNPIVVNAWYRGRIPAQHEVFTNFAGPSATSTQVLSSQIRHYAKTSVNFPITKYIGAKGSYQFGSLPPAFRNFNHVISITLNVSTPGDYEQ